MISVENISRRYGKVTAVNNISFEVDEAEMFGIIGPDGAGKTTLFRILTTLIMADSGSAVIDGMDIVKHYKDIRHIIGYMPGKFSLYQDLTVEENLDFFATVFGTTINENYHLIKDIYQQIEPFKKRRAGALSGGMKQKLALSCALIHKPKVLFLDEPTTGVDPVSRKEFWEMLKHLKKQGITIIVSTPYMDEASLCDRIAFIMNGNFIGIETPANIIGQFKHSLWAVSGSRMSGLLADIRKYPGIKSCYAFGDTHHATVSDRSLTPDKLTRYLEGSGHVDVKIKEITPGIEDCFMDLTAQQ